MDSERSGVRSTSIRRMSHRDVEPTQVEEESNRASERRSHPSHYGDDQSDKGSPSSKRTRKIADNQRHTSEKTPRQREIATSPESLRIQRSQQSSRSMASTSSKKKKRSFGRSMERSGKSGAFTLSGRNRSSKHRSSKSKTPSGSKVSVQKTEDKAPIRSLRSAIGLSKLEASSSGKTSTKSKLSKPNENDKSGKNRRSRKSTKSSKTRSGKSRKSKSRQRKIRSTSNKSRKSKHLISV
ncbi:hypothetical protein DICVIV_02351 [Dictyocaulus viviparus]|uniref:Uncharacterized protein n=1 Tax=Dictyocaulus viviparus TaxID=29172 RepID=A0A0D8Y3Z0_DICVI|nr:hypothetical protein DICVIV_02351 [Dictyocaulus viviparus]